MSCPIILTNATDPGADYTILDLGELVIADAATADVTDMFSLECIANSTDLQTALTAGDITMTYAGDPITDLSDLCTPVNAIGDGTKTDWEWSAGRRGNVTATIDYVRFDRNSTLGAPFVAMRNAEVRYFSARSETFPGNYTVELLKSIDGGTNWTTEKSETIDAQTKLIDYTVSPISLAAGNLLRIRFVKIANNIGSPQASLLVKEI